MEAQKPPYDPDYYNKRLQEELEKQDVDSSEIRKLSMESLLVFLGEIAEKIGLGLDIFLEWFGPLFHDTTSDPIAESKPSSGDSTNLESD